MMKKACMICGILAICLAFSPVKVKAGTFILGVKGWYETTWDSAFLDIYANQVFPEVLTAAGQGLFYDYKSTMPTGTGYLAGPLLGYQSSDKIWSISFAPMVLSNFSQHVWATMTADVLGSPMAFPIEFDVDVTRRDYDLAGSYSLARFSDKASFLEYCKVFLGLKYQEIEYLITTSYNIGGSFPWQETDKYDYNVYMPTIGVGFAYPISNDIVAGIQGGLGMTHVTGDIDVDNGLAYNLEANVNIMPIDKMVLQFGYRYQRFSFNLNGTNGKEYDSHDTTYGPTLTLIYSF